jgi:succinoglycan biosynthesis transport protein ExoP
VPNSEEKQTSLNDYLRIISRRKWLIVLTFLCFTASAVAFSLLTAPIYQAVTTVMVEKQGGMDDYIFTGAAMMRSESKIRNQVEIIKSRSLAQAVVQEVLNGPRRNEFENSFPSRRQAFPSEDHLIRAVQENLSVNPIRDTDILEVSMTAPDPEMAAFLANTVAQEYHDKSLQVSRGEISEVRNFLQNQL